MEATGYLSGQQSMPISWDYTMGPNMRTRITRLSATKDVALFKGLNMHGGIIQGILISPEGNISALEAECKVNITISCT